MLACFLFLAISALKIGAAEIDDAENLRRTGRYEEAAEILQPLAGEDAAAALELARCKSAVGKIDEAVKILTAAAAKHAKDARLPAELALLAFERGNYDDAQKHADRAIELDKNQPTARWVLAELHRVQGRLDEANKAYEWFVDYYNNTDGIDDPVALHRIGQASAQFARWNRNSQQFKFLVATFYPGILKKNENYWPARLEAALLAIEKYDERIATDQLNKALAINPNAAEVHAARAMLAVQNYDFPQIQTSLARAIEINPNLLLAHQLKADYLMADFRTADAIEVLEAARKLNPRSEETLGRLAAAYGQTDGLSKTGDNTRLGSVIKDATAGNAKCGQFFLTLGESLDLLRKYPYAAKYYEEAHRRMPQLVGPRGKLGLMYMRLGEEGKARKLLDESFQIDPFNVRVKNMLEVLDVLENYATIETEHFIIRFDRGQDEILASLASRYLEEEVYGEIVEKMGYRPQGKALFEIFNNAGSHSGHQWFSARMVGLPYVGTIGACAGNMVAITSPGSMEQKFNWARVLKHEFVHVVNLQQTDFNIPHWFTEALAVLNEGYPRPADWSELLARRYGEDTLFTLDDINHGFFRPGSGDDWTLAYCQSELYAEYMIERFGQDAPAKLLAAYADNLPTPAAIRQSFGIDQAEFEKGYREHLKKSVAGIIAARPAAARTLVELEQAAREKPDDADALAELAYAYLQRKSNASARRVALSALKHDRQHPLASYVLARLYFSIGDTPTAVKLLEAALDEEQPHERVLLLLAAIKFRGEDFAEAARLYQLGAKHDPQGEQWLKLLARVYVKTGEKDKLADALAKLVESDSDNLTYRKTLLELALAKKDHNAALNWATQVIHIDALDALAHAQRGQSLAALKKHAPAAEAYELALQIDAEQNEWRLELARAYQETGEKKKAVKALEELLRRSPRFPGAADLLESLQAG